MKRLFIGMTDTGLIRAVNQDAYYLDPDGRFFIVADGMGGHAGGQEASRLATQAIQFCLDTRWQSTLPSQDLLEKSLLEANQAILDDQKQHPERSDMGTTVVVVIFRDEQPFCTHIGDSRLYRLRGSELEQMTEDHTWVARAMRLGEITPDQARTHPLRHVLAQCLGREDLQQIEVKSLSVQSGDRLLLCSDGLTEELSDQRITDQLKPIQACEKAASALINAAKEQGGRDNITVVIVAIDGLSGSDY
ncbi:Stp1/IreP family PP2C-type Ser/Thr phosphatase [Phormidesmis priestleyi ULC007]|uniref:Stp1/IreP family PP2C-type Ser/Thr phosphatase n=1 Tax=Phormidesmis priestleyi ULC007 TaxID=1920490 RepID=A0A2T1D6J4_9CYAN|nr:Stp1/IreP family PP2C-type Ser/Thr phosphatase [Phormidesmis priestleyi]PSB16110.1 Stp1/IreP family PP2C-type Ser/Thr phosphatase [Phormidesmis priestleyi ULC007]PZO50502.1 MAG: Stp1/IreP family PP2C-type Ser/Thr phosphatase [Phormidesmis priestleyi]